MKTAETFTIPKNQIVIVRSNGHRETHQSYTKTIQNAQLRSLIRAEDLDFVWVGKLLPMDHPNVDLQMAVDGDGLRKLLPLNPVATILYLDICKPNTVYEVVGDCAIYHEPELLNKL